MLEFENEVLLNSVQDNQLSVFAKGLPMDLVMTNLFKTYASDVNLVFVLSSNSNEEEYYISKLEGERIKSITTEFSAGERKELYSNGGVFFVTSRILVMDFLKDVIPADKITGLIVLRAHNVIENSQEAFILRLYRSKNKTGFIKAFSQSPTSFLLGFSKLNRIMRCCFLANVSLWPRFHSSIKQSLSKAPSASDVVEIQLHLTETMREIQTNLLDLVSWSVSELKRLVPSLDDEEISAETALTKGFEKIVGAYVDPVWNTISSKSKDILNDIKIFRLLLKQLTKSDSVSFFSTLCQYTSKNAVFKCSWVLTKSAELVIVASRQRLFPPESKKKSAQESGSSTSTSSSTRKSSPSFNPEVHPKWLALSQILKEISDTRDQLNSKSDHSETFAAKLKTLIFAEDVKTCTVLKDYLCHGSDATLGKIAKACDNIKVELSPDLAAKLESIYHENKGIKRFHHGGRRPAQKSAASISDDEDEANKTSGPTEVQVTLTQIERKYEEVEFLQTPVFIRPLKSLTDSEAFAVPETLDKLRPDVIIIFDPSLDLVRSIEVYRARMADVQEVKVYFLSFHNSVEEQIYLTSIQREKRAFEALIQEKGTMLVPNEREARDELNQDLWRDPSKANETVTAGSQSKRNMQNDDNVRQVILVDMREFRSELPSLIHKRGIDLEPLTLDVGDYILTPDVCVERKSISDLVGSLNSGRLFKQAEAMQRHYKKPVLLIEHEQQAQSVASGARYRNDLAQIMSKLQVLTMHFPKLKLIWSPGAHYTAELFHELKRNKEQPDPEQAMSIQKESTGTHSTSKYNPISHNFLSKMPGIDSRNVYALLGRCESLDDVMRKSEGELASLMENSKSASLFYTGLHGQLLAEEALLAKDDKDKKPNAPARPPSFRVGLPTKGTRGLRK